MARRPPFRSAYRKMLLVNMPSADPSISGPLSRSHVGRVLCSGGGASGIGCKEARGIPSRVEQMLLAIMRQVLSIEMEV